MLPEELRAGPRLLRTYRADMATVHVRTVLPQCFLYAVTAAPEPS
jgi:hypothetical protein